MNQTEAICPQCHTKMTSDSPLHYHCESCGQYYNEQFICPFCEQNVQMVKGCGAINYICPKDGLVSSSKVIFHYLPE